MLILPKRGAQRGDLHCQVAFRHDLAGPRGLKQIVFANHLISPLHQHEEQRRRALSEWDRRAVPVERA